MAVWLLGWLVVGSSGRLVVKLLGCLLALLCLVWLFGCLAAWSLGRSVVWLFGRLVVLLSVVFSGLFVCCLLFAVC